jgi:hypothetical protein
MRATVLALLVVSAAACGPEFAVVPAGGMPSVSAQGAAGVVMTALADQWGGEPSDLADFVTPIAVELYNGGPYEVRVSYIDFALRDESGRRFVAISPFVPDSLSLAPLAPATRELGSADESHGAPVTSGAGAVLLASRGGGAIGPPGGSRGGGGVRMGGGGRGMVAPPSVRRSFGSWGVGGGFGASGFRVRAGLRGWYGPGLSYWGNPWLYSSPWVVMWGTAYYPSPPTHDVLFAALPEGVLPPGARVTGFLYFQKATSRNTPRLDLGWTIHDARAGAPLGDAHVALDVVPAR